MTDLHPWQVLHSEKLLDFPPWLQVHRQTVQLPNGHTIHDYLLTPARSYSMVVALTEDDCVLLVRQYKHGIERIVYDFPAGYLETASEAPLAAAQRELREETGYAARNWIALGDFNLDTNRSDAMAHLFFATGLTRISEQKLDDTELLTHHIVPRRDIPAMLANGALPGLACPAAWGLAMAHLEL